MSEACSRQLHTGWNIHICSATMLHQSVWAKLTQSNCILDGISFSTVLLCYTVSLCYTKAYEQSLLRGTAYWMKYPFLQSYYATLKCMNEACSEQLHIGRNIHFCSAIMLHWSVWAKLAQSNCILDGISISAVPLCYTEVYEQSLHRATTWAKLA